MQSNASSRKDVRLAEKQAKIAETIHNDAIMALMSTTGGRYWMCDLLDSCHIGHTAFTGNNDTTNFACGEQSMGLRIWQQLMQICPDNYILMMRESRERYAADDQRSNNSGRNGNDSGTGESEHSDDPDFDRDGNWIGDGPDPRSPGY